MRASDPRDGIDPRGPRFAAAVTAVLLAAATLLALTGNSTARASFGWFAYQPLADEVLFGPGEPVLPLLSVGERAADPGFLLLLAIALLFAWGVASPRTAPWGVLYRRVVQPRLAPSRDREDPHAPRFAQGLGLAVTSAGLALHLAAVPWALPVAGAAAFVAAFLRAVFGLCLGCRLFLLLQRGRMRGRAA